MNFRHAPVAVLTLVLAACGSLPARQPSASHIGVGESATPPAAIPPLVPDILPLPRPAAGLPAETYSVVVTNLRIQDLLFALARDPDVESRFIAHDGARWEVLHGPQKATDLRRKKQPWTVLVQGLNLFVPEGDVAAPTWPRAPAKKEIAGRLSCPPESKLRAHSVPCENQQNQHR